MTSARMKPRARSEWIVSAASSAVAPARQGPGTNLVFPDGEERMQAEQIVGGAAGRPGGRARRSRTRARTPPPRRPASGRSPSRAFPAVRGLAPSGPPGSIAGDGPALGEVDDHQHRGDVSAGRSPTAPDPLPADRLKARSGCESLRAFCSRSKNAASRSTIARSRMTF